MILPSDSVEYFDFMKTNSFDFDSGFRNGWDSTKVSICVVSGATIRRTGMNNGIPLFETTTLVAFNELGKVLDKFGITH